MSRSRSEENMILYNRSARHNFFLGDAFEVGVALRGWEVRSIRQRKISIECGYVQIVDGEAYLINVRIAPTFHMSVDTTEHDRRRRLLLHRSEILKLESLSRRNRSAIIPVYLYLKRGLIKLKIFAAVGKRSEDKRDELKSREWQLDKRLIVAENL